jgi:hypothetical protein
MNFLEKLANAPTERQSSEHLKLLGKRAASLYGGNEVDSLSEAVLRVAGEEGNLNNDQVARISEMANQETWRTVFVEGGNRGASFEPANADNIIGELSHRPEVEDAEALNMLDYSSDVPGEQIPDDISLADAFGVESDSEAYEALNPAQAEAEFSEKTASAAGVARYGVDQAATALASAGETFYAMVKSAHLDDGHGLLQLSKAAAAGMQDPLFAADMMSAILSRLEVDGVKFDRASELRKVAHPLVVNPDHPFIAAAATLERAAFEHYTAGDAHEKLAASHRHAVKALREKLRNV